MKNIMIDMDETIVDKGFLYLINDYGHTSYTENDCKGFYMQDLLENKEGFFKYFLTKNQYDHCVMKEGCKEVIEALTKKYNVYFGTSYIYPEIPTECGVVLHQKNDYLAREFPFISPYNYIFLAHKELLNCEIKIDDSIKNLKNAEIKLLMTAYHNENISDEELAKEGIIRVHNWYDIKKILLDNET